MKISQVAACALWFAIPAFERGAGVALGQISSHRYSSTLATPTATVEISAVESVPVDAALMGYVEGQATFVHEIFLPGQEPPEGNLLVFRLAHSPFEEDVPKPANAVMWTFRAFSPHHYNWTQVQLPAGRLDELNRIQGRASLAIAALRGPAGVVPVIAVIVSSLHEDGMRKNLAIPVLRAPEDVYRGAVEGASGRGSGLPPDDPFRYYSEEIGPCTSQDPAYCYGTYQQRLLLASNQFTQCMAGSAPPVTGAAVSCFVLCVPFLAGSPAAYATCVALCEVGPTSGGIVDATTCTDIYQSQADNAKSSYCGCLTYKQQHCPDMAETDLAGCP